jgi:hypothetical protein
MGQECDCKLRIGARAIPGRAQLETDFLLFRGAERLKVAFKDLTAITANDGLLTLEYPGGPAVLELGAQAAKWAQKILHPPTLLDKLGVKPGLAIAIEGEFDAEFLAQLGQLTKSNADLLLYAAASAAGLARIPRLISKLKPTGSLWIVYPKGVAAIREVEVIEAGRAAGLKDTKVARFSETHTALKFSQPAKEGRSAK